MALFRRRFKNCSNRLTLDTKHDERHAKFQPSVEIRHDQPALRVRLTISNAMSRKVEGKRGCRLVTSVSFQTPACHATQLQEWSM